MFKIYNNLFYDNKKMKNEKCGSDESKLKDSEPIIVEVSIIPDKMRAIQTTADALLELSKAINGVNAHVTVQNCSIVGAEVGIKIQ